MNILIVGLGSIAQKHIRALRDSGTSCRLYALRSSTTPSNNMEGVINVYSIKELENIPIRFAIISNPTSEHKKTILSLLSLHCPLFIEKPLYHQLDIENLPDKIKQADILTYIACNLRFLDCLKYVKNKIDANEKRINEINVYCGSCLPEWRKGDFRKNYSAIPELGGGVHIDLIHELDYLYWIFNTPASVRSVFRNNSSLNIESVDYANYCLVYDKFCANVVLNYYRRDYKRTFEIVFEDETWNINLVKNEIVCNDNVIFSSNQKITDTYSEQMKYFLGLINSNNSSSFNTIHDAYNVLKICLPNDTER
jgi:predicted dehydrogenase